MLEAMQRYRILLIALGIIIVILVAWFFIANQYVPKIPSRGVFVVRPFCPGSAC